MFESEFSKVAPKLGYLFQKKKKNYYVKFFFYKKINFPNLNLCFNEL